MPINFWLLFKPLLISLAAVLVWTVPAFGLEVSLYFPYTDKLFLGAEKRDISDEAFGAELAAEIVAALADGPKKGLTPVLPADEPIRQVFIDNEGTAYVDLNSASFEKFVAGASRERLVVWSLVNSLCLNMDEIKSVKILLDGREAPIFLGHIDISRPLLPDSGLIKEDGQ